MVKISKAAKRYVKAFFEWSKARGKLDEVAKDMAILEQVMNDNPDLVAFLKNPTVSNKRKKEALKKIFNDGISAETWKLIDLLADKDRLDILDEIAVRFGQIHKELQGVVEAELITATPVNDEMMKVFLEKVKEITGKSKVEISNRVDPGIIGGYILQIGDLRIDDSIRGKLNKIKAQLQHN